MRIAPCLVLLALAGCNDRTLGPSTGNPDLVTATRDLGGAARDLAGPARDFSTVDDLAVPLDFSAAPKCGGFVNMQCPGDLFCDYLPSEMCGAGDQQGHCAPRPGACTDVLDPVCGCDRMTYGNDCFRQMAGVALLHTGACP